jgi:glutathione-regulated potassium-efflux system ancillary protein KefG
MAKILLLFAHPALEKSRVNRQLVRAVPDLPRLTFHDLYEEYPDFDIDVPREQQLLIDHDLIILQHPFFWYSTPPIIKQWEDLVLEHNWAYGSKGTALQGKKMLSLITAGGSDAAYQPEGYNRYTMRQFLIPLEQTAVLCRMTYLPPYLIHGTHRLTESEIEQEAGRYRRLLTMLHNDEIDLLAAQQFPYLNEGVEIGYRGVVNG